MIEELILKYMNLFEKKRFSLKDKVFFYREMAYLIEGGIAILDAVKLIQENSNNRAIINICEDLYSTLKKGENFSRSMSRLPKYFNEGDINIVKSGENSGELTNVLKYLAEEYEYIYKIRNQYVGAILYPSFVFILSIFAVYVIFVHILPSIFSIVESFEDVELAFSTKVLMQITEFLMNNGKNILFVIFLFIFGISIFLSTEEGKKVFDKKVLKFPIYGKIIKYYMLVRFLRYLKLLIYSGMSYLDVFMLMKDIMSSTVYKEMIDDTIDGLRKGEMIITYFRKYDLIFPMEVIALLKVGEETASLHKSIENSITIYEEEFNRIIDGLGKIIEPILIIFVGVIVGFTALSVFSLIGTILDSLHL